MPVAKGQAWWSRRGIRWGALALACLVAGGAAVRAALPPVVRWALTRAAERATGLRARVGAVHLSVRRGEARIGELRITHPRSGAPVAGWESLRVRFRYAPLLRGTLRVPSVELDRPFIVLARAAGDAIPLSAFAGPRPQGALPLDLDLGDLEIAHGQVRLLDAAGPGRPMRVDEVTVRLSDLATARAKAERQTSLAITARWEGAHVEATGWVKPFAEPPEADLALRLGDLELPRLDALLSPRLPSGSTPAGPPVALRGGRASGTGRLARGAAGGTQIAGAVDVQHPVVALGDGGDMISAASLRLVADRFEAESFTVREGRIEVEGLDGDVSHLAGLAGRVASLRGAVRSLDVGRRSAGGVRVEIGGVAVRQGEGARALEGAKIRAGAEAIEWQGRSGQGITLEADGLAFRGIGGPAGAGRVEAVRASAVSLDLAARSARGIRLQADRLAGTGLGPQSLAAELRSVRAAVDGVDPGAERLAGVSASLDRAAARDAEGPLGSVEAVRATATIVDVAGRSGTGLRGEADQVAIARVGPQGVSARLQAVRAAAEGVDLRARALRSASVAVDWLAAARAGEAEPFAVLRAARAEVPRADLAAPVVEVARLEVDAPSVSLRRDAEGIDLARLLDGRGPGGRAGQAMTGGAGLAIPPAAVAVGFAQIREGSLTFTDATISPPASVALRDVTVNLLNVRPGAGVPATLVASAKVGAAGSFQLGAQFTAGTFRNANGTARLEGIEVDLARPYLGLPAPFAAITGSLTASAEARPMDERAAGSGAASGVAPAWKIVARAEARELAGRDGNGAVLAEVPSLDIRDVEVTVPDFRVLVGDVAAGGLRLPVERDAAGVVRIAGLPLQAFPRPPAPGPQPPRGSLPPVRVQHVRVTGTVPLVDRARPQPLETAITDLALDLQDVGTEGDRAMGLRLTGQLEEMTFAAAGSTRFGPLQGLAYLDLQSLDLVRWADYLPDAVRGRLADLRGEARLEVAFGAALSDLVVRGRVEAAPLQLADPEGGEGILGVERATIGIERLTLAPLSLHVGSVLLEQPWVNVERRADGRINLLALVPPQGTQAPDAAPAPGGPGGAGAWQTFPVTIERLTVQGGIFDVADRTMTPPFVEQLKAVTGGAEGLSTEGSSRASFHLAGRLSDEAEFTLRGEGQPRLDPASLELQGRLGGFNLVGLSPYVRRLTSHRVERGKIDIDVHYRLEARDLEGENHLRIDQLGVGESEEWPDRFTEMVGVSLPFAVSLLQDSDGVIELEVPVRGDVAHPRFDLGDAIRTAIANAVVATITAPLRLIAGIFEAAGRIDTVEVIPVLFAPGSAQLDAAGGESVERLVAFLNEAPRARIQLAGYAEPEQDGAALRAGDGAQAGAGLGLVRRLARRLGIGGTPPPPDLHALARGRSLTIQEAVRRAGVAPGRVFLAEPVVEKAELSRERGKPAQGRVEFRLVH